MGLADYATVTVTGAAGFIGAHLTEALVHAGIRPTVLVRYRPDLGRIAHLRNRIDVVYADVSDLDRSKVRYMDGSPAHPGLVFHLAAFHHVGRSWELSDECMRANVQGTARVLGAFQNSKIVYMSTSEVYGAQETVPWNERLSIPQPVSPYAVSKYAGELLCAAHQRAGRRVSIVRAFNAYGPGQSDHAVLGELIRKASVGETIYTTPGEQTRDFVYVQDTVRGLIMAAETEYKWPVNLGTGREISIREATDTIVRATGGSARVVRNLPPRLNEIMRMAADTARAMATLGWAANVGFEEGIRRTVLWEQENLPRQAAPMRGLPPLIPLSLSSDCGGRTFTK